MKKPKKPIEKKYLRASEVADMTGLCPGTLANHRFEHRGIAYSKVGHRAVRYELQDVLEYMSRRRILPEED